MKKNYTDFGCGTALGILKGAIENTNEAFVTIDQDSRVIIFNRAAEQIFGYSRDEIIGRDLADILGPGCREGHQMAVARYVKTGEAKLIGHETQFNAMRKNGESFPAAISFSVVEINSDLFFTGIIRDMTETLALQEKVIAGERLAALGQAVAEISHEIKNPLLLIGGFARQLLKSDLNAKDRHKLKIIAEEVKRLEKLLAEMKDLHRPQNMTFEKINLAELLHEIYTLTKADCKGKAVNISLNIADSNACVEGNRQKLKQVLLNVIKNGVEALTAGGQLTIASRVVRDIVEINIIDAGAGIPAKILKDIFTPFFTTKEHGTGLGLCISKKIIEDHPGGSFSIESREGHGTVVTMTFPLAVVADSATGLP